MMFRDIHDPVAGKKADAVPGKDKVTVDLLGPVIEAAQVGQQLGVVHEI
ncbi:MAG: hypothetical protein MZW92_65695 [Comamonadaceae bacterium]|nr:hypothetical protein [Comamonadaceae bacterium]